MIDINLYIPFLWKDIALYNLCKNISANKSIELELEFVPGNIVTFSIRFIRHDHAGVIIDLGLLGLVGRFQFYDNRHWNNQENRWVTEDETIQEYRDYEERERKRKLFEAWLTKDYNARTDI